MSASSLVFVNHDTMGRIVSSSQKNSEEYFSSFCSLLQKSMKTRLNFPTGLNRIIYLQKFTKLRRRISTTEPS